MNQWNISVHGSKILFSYANATSVMNTKQHSKTTPVEVANPYWLKLRYTYTKCEDCKSLMNFTHTKTKCHSMKKVNQWNITMTTEQRSKINPVEVKNPYFLKFRYTYSKCERCERKLPYPNLRQKYIEREEITTNEHLWYFDGFVICEECA